MFSEENVTIIHDKIFRLFGISDPNMIMAYIRRLDSCLVRLKHLNEFEWNEFLMVTLTGVLCKRYIFYCIFKNIDRLNVFL